MRHSMKMKYVLLFELYWVALLMVPFALLPTSDWIIVGIVLAMLIGLITVGHVKLAHSTCDQRMERLSAPVLVHLLWVYFCLGFIVVLMDLVLSVLSAHWPAGASMMLGAIGGLVLGRTVIARAQGNSAGGWHGSREA